MSKSEIEIGHELLYTVLILWQFNAISSIISTSENYFRINPWLQKYLKMSCQLGPDWHFSFKWLPERTCFVIEISLALSGLFGVATGRNGEIGIRCLPFMHAVWLARSLYKCASLWRSLFVPLQLHDLYKKRGCPVLGFFLYGMWTAVSNWP